MLAVAGDCEPAVQPNDQLDQVAPTSLAGPLHEVYRAYAAVVWRTLRRLGVPESQVDDAVQDVFLIVHRRLPDFEGRSSLKTWVYGIVLRVAKDYRRAETRHHNRIERLAELLVSDPPLGHCPAEAAERQEANLLVHTILDSLPDEQREMLVLVELEEVPVREAAQAVGTRLRTCQRRLQAARAAFSAALTQYLDSYGRSVQ